MIPFQEDTYDYSQSTVELFFVDYGDSETKPISELWELKDEFLKLKYQAIPCSLAKVQPNTGSQWSPESIDHICQLTHCAMWKNVWVRIEELTMEGVAVVEIIDSAQGEEDVNVGAELVSQGLAQWS